jgi:hypothetical protein
VAGQRPDRPGDAPTEVVRTPTGGPADAGDAGEATLGPQTPTEPPGPVSDLAAALTRLRSAIGGTSYPLVMPSADEA